MMTATADLRYPVGTFRYEGDGAAPDLERWILEVEALPTALRAAVDGLDNRQLDTPYRPDGWTVRQVVHHLADSHVNSYARFRLAMTEQEPTIKPYDEAKWAELPDARTLPVEVSLRMLEALHERWVALMRTFEPEDFKRGFVHPEQKRVVSLGRALAMYAWHGRHHVAHITALREREGWR